MIRITATRESEVYKRSSVIVSAFFAFVMAVGPALLEAWSAAPPSLRDALPDGLARWVSTAAFALVIVARMTAIHRVPPGPAPEPRDA